MKSVFSTSVEVIPTLLVWHGQENSILHECGGDPKLAATLQEKNQYSPRVWRWSLVALIVLMSMVVFSTSVEVIL